MAKTKAKEAEANVAPHLVSVNPDESPIDSNGFVGVDPIYQNFADVTGSPEPSESESGDEKKDTEPEKKDAAPAAPQAPQK